MYKRYMRLSYYLYVMSLFAIVFILMPNITLAQVTIETTTQGQQNPQATQPPQQPDLITSLINQPMVWLCVLALIIGFVLIKLRGNKVKPEEKQMYGRELRASLTTKIMKDKLEIWGTKYKYVFYQGFNRVGKTIKIDLIPQIEKDKESYYYSIAFRNFGLWAWIKAVLLNRFQIVFVEPDVITMDHKKKHIYLNPNAHIIRDSGIWTMKTKKQIGLIDDYNIHNDSQNLRGLITDMPRRIMSLSPQHSGIADIRELDAEIKERERKSKNTAWSS